MSADLIELSNILAGWMLYIGGKADSPEAGALLSDEMLTSGAAYKTWLEMTELQGGDIRVFDDPASHHKPLATRLLKADRAGYLHSMDCREVGWAVQRLGAGRAKPGDPVSAHAGIEVHVKLGAKVEQGQPLLTLFAEDAALLDEPEVMLRATYKIAPEPPQLNPKIREIIRQEA
jgi:pyrimidine-nucleoside phosphorylase